MTIITKPKPDPVKETTVGDSTILRGKIGKDTERVSGFLSLFFLEGLRRYGETPIVNLTTEGTRGVYV